MKKILFPFIFLLMISTVIAQENSISTEVTGGSQDWDLAVEDRQVWLDWLREQDGADNARIAIIGASIGSNLALMGCVGEKDTKRLDNGWFLHRISLKTIFKAKMQRMEGLIED
jgi:hypothetical protein